MRYDDPALREAARQERLRAQDDFLAKRPQPPSEPRPDGRRQDSTRLATSTKPPTRAGIVWYEVDLSCGHSFFTKSTQLAYQPSFQCTICPEADREAGLSLVEIAEAMADASVESATRRQAEEAKKPW